MVQKTQGPRGRSDKPSRAELAAIASEDAAVTRIIGAPAAGAEGAPTPALDALLGELDVALRAYRSEPTDDNGKKAQELRARVEAMDAEVVTPLGQRFDPETMVAGNPWSDIEADARMFRLVALSPGINEDGTVAGVLSVGCVRKGEVVRKALVFVCQRNAGGGKRA